MTSEQAEKIVKIAGLVLAVAADVWVIWNVLLAEEHKIAIKAELRRITGDLGARRAAAAARRRAAFDVWLFREGMREYEQGAELAEIVGIGSSLRAAASRRAPHMGEAEAGEERSGLYGRGGSPSKDRPGSKPPSPIPLDNEATNPPRKRANDVGS